MANYQELIDDLQAQIDWIEGNDAHKFPGYGNVTFAIRRAVAVLRGFPQDTCRTCRNFLSGMNEVDSWEYCKLLRVNTDEDFYCGYWEGESNEQLD